MSIRVKMFLSFVVVAALCCFSGFSFGRSGAGYNGMILPIATAAAALVLAFIFTRIFAGRIRWYECILDAIPFPVSATDMNRSWTFVNTAVEGILKKTRGQIAGQPCANWGAGICNTENCGINCLNRGESTTFFSQGGMDFKVYIAYLKNSAGKRIGHVEIVEDMTELFARQKTDAAIAESISRMISELSDHASDVAAKTAANAEQASRAAALTGSMKENADKGSEQMKHMITAVQEIKESAQTINKVINTINEIAFQTNLLALNASVEAARAGEAGKGFAVVADEVRNLATRSAQAANDTNSIIRTSIEKSELGFRIAGETAASLAEILDGLTSANQIVTGIATSSGEQSLAIQNINSSVQQMTDVIRRGEPEAASAVAGYLE